MSTDEDMCTQEDDQRPASPPPKSESAQPTLSKNQQKKQRRLEMKLEFRQEKRKLERERKKETRKRCIAEGGVRPPSRKQLRKEVKDSSGINVVIDSSFEDYMIENDLRKLVKQIQRCYAINRRAKQPFKYCVSSFDGKVKDIIDNLDGTSSWDVKWSSESYDVTFAKENIIYLCAESDNVLSELEQGKVYVIGGLVDHNSKKGLCYKLAVEKGIAHAQLPISKYLDLKCRKVLTIDHVFEILLKYQEDKDWESAFFQVIPKRKGAQSRCGSTAVDEVSEISKETEQDDSKTRVSESLVAEDSNVHEQSLSEIAELKQ